MSSPRVFSVLLLASGLMTCTGQGGDEFTARLARQIRQVFERCSPAVVRIEATDEHGRLAGTGFFIDPNGTLFTSFTVGGATHDISVTFCQTTYPAQRLFADPRSGVALLKIEANTPFLTMRPTTDLPVSSPVMAIGYPLDLPVSPSFGLVAGYDIRYKDRYFLTRHVRASVPVQRGEGGAPLLDLDGKVVGILISSLEGAAGCFALPIEAAEKVRCDFLRFGEVRPGSLGVRIAPGREAVQGSVVRVDGLIPGMPAAASGLQAGDVFVEVNGNRIAAPDDLLNASFFFTAGDPVKVVAVRDGQRLEFTIPAAPQTDASMRVAGGAERVPTTLTALSVAGE